MSAAQVPACVVCTQGVMDSRNSHALGTCPCECHGPGSVLARLDERDRALFAELAAIGGKPETATWLIEHDKVGAAAYHRLVEIARRGAIITFAYGGAMEVMPPQLQHKVGARRNALLATLDWKKLPKAERDALEKEEREP